MMMKTLGSRLRTVVPLSFHSTGSKQKSLCAPTVRSAILTALVLAAGAALAQPAALQAFEFRGKVVDPDGRPIPGARVMLVGATTGAALTAANGFFALEGVYERTTTLQILRQGYFGRTVSLKPQPGVVRVFCLMPEGTRSPYVGVEVDEDIAANGARVLHVTSVEPGSPAERAGIIYGDEILRFAGEPVNSDAEFFRLVGRARVNQIVEMLLRRRDEERTVAVRIERRKTSAEQEAERQAAARGKVFDIGTLVYFRDAAITNPVGIGTVDRRSFRLDRAGTVDMTVGIPETGEYQVQVIAFTSAGQGFPTWSLEVENQKIATFTTDSTYFRIYDTQARLERGRRPLRIVYEPPQEAASPLFLYAMRVNPTRRSVRPDQSVLIAPQPSPVPIEEFIRQRTEQGDFLWSKEDPEDSGLTWVALKEQFLVLFDRNSAWPTWFDVFLSQLDNCAQHVNAIAFTPTEVWAGCNGGLFQYDRRLRKWYQWAIEGHWLDVEVNRLEVVPGGRLLVTFVHPTERRSEVVAFDLAARKWIKR